MSEKRTLRICCPIHEACFEVEENPKILCEITGHALSSDFPNAEFWEFCCNCATFAPSKLGRGEKARNLCYSCENEISKRFLCASCKVVSFECGTQAKGRSYFVTSTGIDPVCPGCAALPLAGSVVRHECADMDAAVYTACETCPFCLEKTSPFFPEAAHGRMAGGPPAGSCPQCQAAIVPGSAFCGKCKYQLRGDLPAEKLGTDITRSQLLGSLCPNCSTPITPGSGFCAECGQAVKSEALPPPPPPPPPPASSAKPAVTTPKPPPVAKILAGVVGGLFFLVLIAIGIRSSIEGGGSSAGRTTPSPLPANTRVAASPTATASANTNTNFPLPETVEQTYTGTIGTRRQKFTISLTRVGTQVTGTAETPKSWDKLVGTIDTDGYFDLKGYERGDMDLNTGDYTGQISGGTISGRWSNGTSGSDFTASR